MGKKTILVADDEPNIVSLLEDMLSSDFEIVRAYDGTQALWEIRTHKPHLILMDMMMPGMTGYEVVRSLQSDPELKAIPIILITAKDFDPTTEDLLKQEANVVEYVTKPLKPSELILRIQELLK